MYDLEEYFNQVKGKPVAKELIGVLRKKQRQSGGVARAYTPRSANVHASTVREDEPGIRTRRGMLLLVVL
jgi:hypothetical protein